jgi:putative inorganic carbon (HCO3(-)) transporter
MGFGREALNPKRNSAQSTLLSRVDLWKKGLSAVSHSPYTGIGMGTFAPVPEPYNTYPHVHSHNNLIQAAVDLGVFGLAAYAALLIAFFYSAVRTYRRTQERFIRGVIVGLGAGMVAHQVFGITDAFMLGTKPGLIMWVFLGLMAALDWQYNRLRTRPHGRE